MAIKDILAIISSPDDDDHIIRQAEQLAIQHDAFLTVLIVDWLPAVTGFYDGGMVDPGWGEVIEESGKELRKKKETVEKRLAANVDRGGVDTLLIERVSARWAVAVRARHADLALVARPTRKEQYETQQILLQAALFGSGRPVLAVPPGCKGDPIGRRVVAAWDAGREAARAIADAIPLLDSAELINVVTIDGEPSASRYGDLPGGEISTHLARHGLEVELRNVASAGRTEAQVLHDEARDVSADLIVMGAYGHSRFQEIVFGGMTREMLVSASVPILLSH